MCKTNFKSPFADTADFARTSVIAVGNGGGDLTGTFPNPTLANNSVSSQKIVDNTVQRTDVQTNSNHNTADTGDFARERLLCCGNAGGDLTGTFPQSNTCK